MRERRRRECDREGRSSSFRRKMRPRSGMHGPVIHKCGRRIPYAGRSRFAAPRPALRVATAKGGAVSSAGRCDPAAGCTARSSISAVVASPTRVDPASRVPRPALRVATAKGGAVASEGRCDPVAGCTARSSISAVVASPTRVDPASRVPRPALRVATAKGGAVASAGRSGRSRFAGPSPCASGRDREGRSSSFRRKMRPRSGMRGPVIHKRGRSHPLRGPIPLRGPLVQRSGGAPFARSLIKQPARKASSRLGCGKIGRSQRYTPWYRRPSYDLRRAPCDHPDFISNALREDLFRGSLARSVRCSQLFHVLPPVSLAIPVLPAPPATPHNGVIHPHPRHEAFHR